MSKVCHIVGGGDFFGIRPTGEGDFIIAADKGLLYLQNLGITPNLVIGDFDSLGHTPNGRNIIVLPCEKNDTDITFLKYLQDFIAVRFKEMPEGSYTTSLFKKGVNRMAQKVGEEAVETVIEAVNGTEEGFLYEASDLVYHLIVLLTSKGYSLDDLARELKKRHK